MNKRGQEDKLFFTIWEIIAASMVIIIILVAVRGLANNTSYWKRYYSTDLGLVADLENTNQGDFVINYALKENGKGFWASLLLKDKQFEIVLENSSIQAYDAPEHSKSYGNFPFAKSSGTVVQKKSVIADFLTLSKIGNTLMLDRYAPVADQTCLSVDTKKGTEDLKFTVKPLNNNVASLAKTIDYTLKIIGGPNPKKSESIIFIAISTSTASDNVSNIIFYSFKEGNPLKSEKMACILNKNYAAKPLSNIGSKTTPYAGSLDNNPDFKNAISQITPGNNEYVVIIEIPSSILNKESDIASTIKSAYEEYYR
jgi:hypothetical protein